MCAPDTKTLSVDSEGCWLGEEKEKVLNVKESFLSVVDVKKREEKKSTKTMKGHKFEEIQEIGERWSSVKEGEGREMT